jgi:hypothetical protein
MGQAVGCRLIRLRVSRSPLINQNLNGKRETGNACTVNPNNDT